VTSHGAHGVVVPHFKSAPGVSHVEFVLKTLKTLF